MYVSHADYFAAWRLIQLEMEEASENMIKQAGKVVRIWGEATGSESPIKCVMVFLTKKYKVGRLEER